MSSILNPSNTGDSNANKALATVTRITSLVLEGALKNSDVADVLRDAVLTRTIEGASTVTLDVYDNDRVLLKSGIFSSRTKVVVDGFTFELVQVRKSGNGLSLTFEDLPIAALRRRKTPLKVNANTVTHVDFAERMVKEESWLNFWVPPEFRAAEKTRVELTRGKPDATSPEDSWAALGRIADERGWRRYVIGKDTIAYVPETYLLTQEPAYTLVEGVAGVEDVDFDFDSGKPSATVKVRVRAGRWEVPVGSAVLIKDLGPATGSWLVSSITRSLFSLFVEVTLTKARPVLPEPEAPKSSSAADSSGFPLLEQDEVPVKVDDPPPAVPAALADDSSYPSDPSNLVPLGQGGHRLIAGAAASFHRVEEAVGRMIPITDSYRSVASQAAAYAADPSRFAKPGGSAHGEGRAVDVNLGAFGVGGMSSDPKKWHENATWNRLNGAFMAEGWCNYQYHNGTTKGRTSEPWHWSWQVCK